MSFEITTAFVQQFNNTLTLLAQQKQSRLMGTMLVEPAVVGDTYWHDQIGTAEMQAMTTRHGDTPIANIPHRRRKITLAPYNVADLVDKLDAVRMLADPTSPYTQALNAAANRKKDGVAIAAFFATANTGADGSTPVTFPSGNQIAVNDWSNGSGSGNAGLTISKMISAKQLLDDNEAGTEDDEPRFMMLGGKQLSNLLATTEATSGDYAEVKALVKGTIDTFMGFNIIRMSTTKLLTNGSGYYRIPFWTKSGMMMTVGAEPIARIDNRPDKNNATQIYEEMLIGAARVEEAKVGEIVCA